MRCLLIFAFLLALSLSLNENTSAEPEVFMVSVDPPNVDNQEDQPVTFEGDCSICNEEELDHFYWRSTLDGVIAEGSDFIDINFDMSSTGFSTGDHEITLQVRDTEGNMSEINANSTAYLGVTEGHGGGGDDSIDVNFDITPPTINLGQTARFAACQDMEPEPQPCVDDMAADLSFDWKIQWESDVNDTWNYLGDQESFEYVNFQEGLHDVRLIITNNDDDEVSDPAYQDFMVLPPIPTAVILYNNQTIGDGYTITTKEGQDVPLGSLCLDNVEDVIDCDHFWRILEHGSDGDLLFELTGKDIVLDNLMNGEFGYGGAKYDIMMRAEDDAGTFSAWEEIIVKVYPPNVNPVAGILIDPPSLGGLTPEYYQNTDLTFQASGFSPEDVYSYDDDGEIVAWKWWFNNVVVSENWYWIESFNETGIYQIKLEVQDDDGAWSTRVSTNFKIVTNTPPSVSFVMTVEVVNSIADSDFMVFRYSFDCTIGDAEGSVTTVEGWIYEYGQDDLGTETVTADLFFTTNQPQEYCNYYEDDSDPTSLVLVDSDINWTATRGSNFEIMLWAKDDGGLESETSQSIQICMEPTSIGPKNFVASYRSDPIDVGESFTIDFSETTGCVEHYKITVLLPDSPNKVYEITNSQFTIEGQVFASAGNYPLDITVIWADGVSQVGLADFYAPIVQVGSDDDNTDSSKNDDAGGNGNSVVDDEGGLSPSISLIATMALLSLLAVLRRQR